MFDERSFGVYWKCHCCEKQSAICNRSSCKRLAHLIFINYLIHAKLVR